MDGETAGTCVIFVARKLVTAAVLQYKAHTRSIVFELPITLSVMRVDTRLIITQRGMGLGMIERVWTGVTSVRAFKIPIMCARSTALG